MTAPVLQTHHLEKRFGGITATQDVSIAVERGARHALIGPNGAGKTTLVNLLTGVLGPTAGTIDLDGEEITSLPPHQRVRRGLVRTFQINQLFERPDAARDDFAGHRATQRRLRRAVAGARSARHRGRRRGGSAAVAASIWPM